MNTVYLKWQWDQEFDKEHTEEGEFGLNKNMSKSKQMMKQSKVFSFAFLKDVEAKILEYCKKASMTTLI